MGTQDERNSGARVIIIASIDRGHGRAVVVVIGRNFLNCVLGGRSRSGRAVIIGNLIVSFSFDVAWPSGSSWLVTSVGDEIVNLLMMNA